MLYIDHRASYLALEFVSKEVAGLLSVFYGEKRPDTLFGHPNANVLIIIRKDLPFVCSYMNRAGIPQENYVLHAVFLEGEVGPHEVDSLRSKFRYAIASVCDVCREPMLNGPHKHKLQFCEQCAETTVHTTPFVGHPFGCKGCR